MDRDLKDWKNRTRGRYAPKEPKACAHCRRRDHSACVSIYCNCHVCAKKVAAS